MSERKVTVRVLRELLEKRPKCDDYAGKYVIYENGGRYKGFCHRDMEKWFREFTEAFNQFEKQLLNVQLLEKLATLEHEQWIAWSKSIVREEQISLERYNRWVELWVPYEDLTEEQKEQDRVWARKVLEVILKEIEVERK